MAAGETTFVVPEDSPTITEIHVFNAPAPVVYEALTRPEHIKDWYGPRRLSVPVAEMDVRVGGAYHFVNRDAEGNDFGFHGVYREVVPDRRLVYTWVYEAEPDIEAVTTAELDEHDGKTKLTTTTVFPTPEDRDGYLAEDATEGATESMERLEEVVAAIR
jgi:uncharacterized protein YndB with AHSA1/START domain